jgi:hypothetical protein
VSRACEANKDGLLCDEVPPLAIGSARVDGVTMVEATTDGVAFNYLIAHVGGPTDVKIFCKLRDISRLLSSSEEDKKVEIELDDNDKEK